MVDLVIKGPIAERIQERARQENRTVEEIVSRMFENYPRDEHPYDPEVAKKTFAPSSMRLTVNTGQR
jgi:hypothetical protein